MKKYLPLFLLSAILVDIIYGIEVLIVGFVYFGNGPAIVGPIVVVIDIFLVLLISYSYAKIRKLSFFKSLIALTLPIAIMFARLIYIARN